MPFFTIYSCANGNKKRKSATNSHHCHFAHSFWQAVISLSAVLVSCHCSRAKLKPEMYWQLVSAAGHLGVN